MKRNLLIALKLSILIAAIGAVVVTLLTNNREYFHGMVFSACIVQIAFVIRSLESEATDDR